MRFANKIRSYQQDVGYIDESLKYVITASMWVPFVKALQLECSRSISVVFLL
jgi:hypothetical protein